MIKTLMAIIADAVHLNKDSPSSINSSNLQQQESNISKFHPQLQHGQTI